MKQVAEEQDLYKACQIIFEPDPAFLRDFLKYIQVTGVKSAFPKRAMEGHPDREKFQADHGRYYRRHHRHNVAHK